MKVIKIGKSGSGNMREFSVKNFPFHPFFRVDCGITLFTPLNKKEGRSRASVTAKLDKYPRNDGDSYRWVEGNGFTDFITLHVQDGIKVSFDGDNVILLQKENNTKSSE